MQDLSGFSVPKGFRGGNAIKVHNYGGRYRQQYLLVATSSIVSLAGFLLRLFGAK